MAINYTPLNTSKFLKPEKSKGIGNLLLVMIIILSVIVAILISYVLILRTM